MTSYNVHNVWTKIKRERGLYRYNPSGQYFARVRFRGRLIRRKLDTDDLALARRKLRSFKDDLERVDATRGNASFGKILDDYVDGLTGAESTIEDKKVIIKKLKATWFGIDSLPLRTVRPSSVATWLSRHYGHLSAAAYNGALCVVRSALDAAVRDKVIVESPAVHLTYHKRKQPIRLTPTHEQFKAIIADVRSQPFNADANDSADLLEAMGLLGLGQAELSGMKREHIDLESGRILVYRHKTSAAFAIPIFPQARALIEKLCQGRRSSERLFRVAQARKALSNSCRRLGFPQFTHRSFRRLFITTALEGGVDVKVVATWQGHRDGGALILRVYSHVRSEHSDRMAQLMADEQPANVVPITAAKA